jgi:hypothetical protein
VRQNNFIETVASLIAAFDFSIFLLWDYLKERVYSDKPCTIEALKDI